MKVNVLGIVKVVAGLAVNTGTGVVVGNLVKATTPDDLNKFQRVLVGIGGASVSAVLGNMAANYVSDQIDVYATQLDAIIHPAPEVEEAVEEAKEAVSDAVEAVGEAAETVVKDITKPQKPATSE